MLILPLLLAASAQKPTTVHFKAADGLKVTADVYMAHASDRPFIVLFHQAGWSRGEYQEIAPRLNELGYNCMAVDQRSGKSVNGVDNETAARAAKAKKPAGYLDALPDMRAALSWARKKHAKGKLIAWGSSYSAALVVRLAGTEPKLFDVGLAFAPGEYFKALNKFGWVEGAAKKIEQPSSSPRLEESTKPGSRSTQRSRARRRHRIYPSNRSPGGVEGAAARLTQRRA